ncbi:MAG: hypothetical protein QF599_05590 [Planctomycetota bacterium]|jgi:uncharacterized membrane protein|nr:hypothetical protein [Planctomycetota bacterium]MDP6518750.1 hypothetical protein [Planctomycetota bacterium]MDP6955428.1 hypothetical protein [Planctomycetota bacterium]
MNDLALHILLFCVAGLVVVLLGALYGEADDRRALRSVPRRLLVFLFGCGAVAAVLLLLEHTLASVN